MNKPECASCKSWDRQATGGYGNRWGTCRGVGCADEVEEPVASELAMISTDYASTGANLLTRFDFVCALYEAVQP